MQSPIQNLELIDIVGERLDCGIDFVVVCSGPLDESVETLSRLSQKLRGYLNTACSPTLWTAYPNARTGPVRIFVSCEYPISSGAHGLINSLTKEAGLRGVEIRVVESMSMV
jgi:hypothetical protein